MSAGTHIEWTDATWNPMTGCSKVSQGCKHCYAERLFHRAYGRDRVGNASTGEERPREFTDVWMHPDRIDQPLRWKKPRRIFVNSMSDIFHEDVTDRFMADIFGMMAAAHWHQFQILTKRPARALALLGAGCMGFFQDHVEECTAMYSDVDARWPLQNVWLGVSVEDQATADERIPLLMQTPAAVRFVSYEPALGPVDFKLDHLRRYAIEGDGVKRLDWIIAGGESGPRARPSHPDWFRSVRDQCASAGVPFFFKQWGEWAPVGTLDEVQSAKVKHASFHPGVDYCFIRVGKKLAGRLLDGRIHDDYPGEKT